MKTNTLNLTVKGDNVVSEQHYSSDDIPEKILLFCHGFPGTNRLTKLTQALENEPISVVEINYRGDKKSGGKFSFSGSIDDIKSVATHLKDEYGCRKVDALGYSMGGFYVVNILKDEPNMFDKAILLNPVVDTQAFFSNKPLMDELWMYANNILSLKKPEFYEKEIKLVNEEFNPMNFAYELKTPIDIVQSTADEVLSPETAKKFYSLLNCKKNYFEVPNAKHDLMGDEKQLIHAIRS